MKKIIFLALSLSVFFGLQSCLKDKDFQNGKYGTAATTSAGVAFAQGSTDTTKVGYSLNLQNTPLTPDHVVLALVGTPALSTDVVVSITQNPGLLTVASGLTALPAGQAIVPAQVIIPAGKQTVYVPIKYTNPSLLTLGVTYGIGLTITSASNGVAVQNNKKLVLVSLNLANQYEGTYDVTGTRYNYTGAVAFPYPGPIPAGFTPIAHPATKAMNTVDENTSEIGVAGLGAALGYYYLITVPAGSTGNVDKDCILNFSPLFNTDNSGIEKKLCTYNPSTKTFNVVIRYINSGGNARIMVEKFVKQ